MIKTLENKLVDISFESDNDVIDKSFKPSKTSQNGLKFITNDDEIDLINRDICDDVNDVFKIVYIILKQRFDCIPKYNIVKNLYNDTMPKLKVKNLSNTELL